MNNSLLTTVGRAILHYVHKLATPVNIPASRGREKEHDNKCLKSKMFPASLSEEKIKLYVAKIETIEKTTAFFKTACSIHDLSKSFDIPCRQLTDLLNHHYNMRFNDFINGYRIRYILKQFGEGKLKEYTMEAIAFEAGFASRTTFFTAFKKYTGKNPTQFIHFSRGGSEC